MWLLWNMATQWRITQWTPPITTPYNSGRHLKQTPYSLHTQSCCGQSVSFTLTMAEEEAGIFVNQEQFSCSICMELLRDPVTIPCGHNYCMECIKTFWEQKSQRKLCSCPQCRQTFSPRPALNKNTLFAEVVERLRHTGIHSDAIPGVKNDEDIAKEKQVLVMFCEVCLTSHLTLNVMLNLCNLS